MENARIVRRRRKDQAARHQQHLRTIFAPQDDHIRHCSGQHRAESLVGGERVGLGEYVLSLMTRSEADVLLTGDYSSRHLQGE